MNSQEIQHQFDELELSSDESMSIDSSEVDESDISDIDDDIESTDVSSIEVTDDETEEESIQNDFQDEILESDSDESESDEKAIEEIRFYQRTTHNLISYNDFKQLVLQIGKDYNMESFDEKAIEALQVATEAYIIELFQKTQMNACMAGRQTIQPKDMNLARYHENNS